MIEETYTEPRDDQKVLVCDKCLRACCWYGDFMCDDAVSAGLYTATVADLKKLAREHWNYWSDEYLTKIYGDATRDFIDEKALDPALVSTNSAPAEGRQ